MKYEIPAMLASGGGAIVNMASTAGLGAVPGMGSSVGAKHGVVGLTKTAAVDYAESGDQSQRVGARSDLYKAPDGGRTGRAVGADAASGTAGRGGCRRGLVVLR